MRNYREIISDLILTFGTAAARYTTVCESLLGELMLPDEDYTEFIDNPRKRMAEHLVTGARPRPSGRLIRTIHPTCRKASHVSNLLRYSAGLGP
jgi:hypothetical protein